MSSLPITPNLWLVAVIFAAGFAVRILIAWSAGHFTNFDTGEMIAIVRAVAHANRFADPYAVPTGPTAHMTPVIPLMLAGIMKVAGDGALFEAIKIVTGCLASGLRCAMLPFLARTLNIPSEVGVVAGVLSVFYVSTAAEIRGTSEYPFAAVALIGLTILSVRLWRSEDWKTRLPWGYGFAWGLSIFIFPSLFFVLACLLLIALTRCGLPNIRRFITAAVVVLGCVFLSLLPWGLRNYSQLGSFILTRSNLGLELWVSNGPGAAFDMPTNMGSRREHPTTSVKEAKLVAELGEVEYNRLRLADTITWIRQNPWEFSVLSWQRFAAWWFPPTPQPLRRIAGTLLTLVAFTGLGMLFRTDAVAGTVILATWVGLPFMYYFIQWSTRYRFPLEWQMLFTASLALTVLWRAAEARWLKRTPPFRTSDATPHISQT